MDALRRIDLESSRSIGVFAVRVDAKDDNSVQFYQRFGFIQYVSNPRRLFLPIATLRKGIVASREP
jgi:hypothetical protein